MGLKDEMGADTVKIFCPKCQCVYHPPPMRSRSSNHHGAGAAGVDGAAFGTTFPHLFLMTFSNLVPDPLPPNSAYVPRVFGFRVHMSARERTLSKEPDPNKSSKTTRLALPRKSSSQSVSKQIDDENDTKPAAKPPAASQDAQAEENATAGKSVEANGDGDEASGKQKAKMGSKRRTTDSAGDSSSARKADSNGGLMDNSAKRRKKIENGAG